MKTQQVTIPQLRRLILLAKSFNVFNIESPSFKEQELLVDNLLIWQELVDKYDNKVKKLIKVLNIEFDEEGNIIKGNKEYFRALLNHLLDKVYYIEPMLSYNTLKSMIPTDCSIAKFSLAKQYFCKD